MKIKNLTLPECIAHVRERSTPVTTWQDGRSIVRVTEELKVFKKVTSNSQYYGEAIVNLIIPVGALVYMHEPIYQPTYYSTSYHSRKMRASEAFVHSIAELNCRDITDRVADIVIREDLVPKLVRTAPSKWDPSFVYRTGQTVKPRSQFGKLPKQCASGIHFFINVMDAIVY